MKAAFRKVAVLLCLLAIACAEEKQRPLMRDFIGLCGHTVQFKSDLYAPVTRLVRDYHPMRWDFRDDTDYAAKFPPARNNGMISMALGGKRDPGRMRA